MMGVHDKATKAPTAAKRFSRTGQLVDYIKQPDRVLAILSDTRLCDLHRRSTGMNLDYAVLTDPHKPYVLVTNRPVGKETDLDPFSRVIRAAPPEWTGGKVNAVFGDKIELVGVDVPAAAERRIKFQMTLYFRVLGSVGSPWKTFVHFDGKGMRFQADHTVRCGTTRWRSGDWIVDSFDVEASTGAAGTYTTYVGFYKGRQGSWRNMKVTGGTADKGHRVPVGTIWIR